jgi:hypothetical protein
MAGMTSVSGFRPVPRLFLVWLLLAALGTPVAAQSTAEKPPEAPAKSQSEEQQERRVTPEEAEELFRSIEPILEFVSKQTGMPVHRPVKRELSGREAVQALMEERLADDEDAQRLKRSEAVLKKFGLLPRDFDLSTFLVALLREQVAGFYNFRTQTVHLLDWVEPESQLPLLAHELTHAVQDQNFTLEEWVKGPRQAAAKGGEIEFDIATDEASTARQAVIEGQAMVVLVNFLLAPLGRTAQDSPDLIAAMQAGMAGASESPLFDEAPLLLQEALLFPYREGMNFVLAVLRQRGREGGFTGLMREPPRTTRHILLPHTYLEGENLPDLEVPDFKQLLPGYEPFDAGAIGQLDTAILLRQYGAEKEARRISEAWRSGYYYAARPGQGKEGDLALVYASLWATPQAAREFAGIYSAAVPQRYPGAKLMESGETGVQRWQTKEGPVLIEQRGDLLLVMESLDAAAAAKVRRRVLAGSE